MGLLDLQTNLKDLKYPSAKESPVIERINEWVDGDGFKDRPLLQGVGLTDDGVDTTFRGGITTWWGRAQTDFVRIKKLVLPDVDITLPSLDVNVSYDAGALDVDLYPGKFEFTFPQFLKRQTGLQLMNPKISAPMAGLIDTAPANQRTFNPVSLATQVLLSGTGIHIKREGLVPFNNRGYINNTRLAPGLLDDPTGDILGSLLPTKKFDSDGLDNRLLYLFEQKVGNKGELRDKVEGEPTTSLGALAESVNAIADVVGGGVGMLMNKIGGKGEPLYDYWGGPGSMFGIGRTFIGRYVDSTKGNDGVEFPTVKPEQDGHYDSQNQIHQIQNYLLSLGRPNARNYINDKREQLYDLGVPGSQLGSEKFLKEYTVSDSTAQDKVNMFPITEGIDNVFKSSDGYTPKDFVNFRFEALDSLEPSKGNLITFRAFLEDMTDGYSANHNTFKYNGRGEEFYTYSGFRRDISFGFKVAAQTRDEMKPLYQKLNYLASNTAPEYSDQGRIRTPFMRVTVGDYFYRIPGVLGSLNITWMKDYPWEINLEQSDEVLVLPHVLDVAVQFKPVHDFLPQKSIDKSPFIGVTNWVDGLKADPARIEGCTDPEAVNFDPNANLDDGSCISKEEAEEEIINREARLDTSFG